MNSTKKNISTSEMTPAWGGGGGGGGGLEAGVEGSIPPTPTPLDRTLPRAYRLPKGGAIEREHATPHMR